MRIKENIILGSVKEAISFLLKPLRINILKGYFKSFTKVIGDNKEGKCFREYRALQTPRHLLLDYNLYREERREMQKKLGSSLSLKKLFCTIGSLYCSLIFPK